MQGKSQAILTSKVLLSEIDFPNKSKMQIEKQCRSVGSLVGRKITRLRNSVLHLKP